MNSKITKITAREILDSRGNPTVEVEVFATHGHGRAMVPSGASTGIHEALELRDGGNRYNGKGVLKAIRNINKIENLLKGTDVTEQIAIDTAMVELDGTHNKSRLGANAILGVSLAASRAAADSLNIPLYQHIKNIFEKEYPNLRSSYRMPVPYCNIINGGKHAGNKLAMQEFMITPIKISTFSKAVQAVSETYHTLRSIIRQKYGPDAINVGDEGGFAPPLKNETEALNLIKKAIAKAGYTEKVKIAIDAAASEFFIKSKNMYKLEKTISSKELEKRYLALLKKYDIVSLEDPFEQDGFEDFRRITQKLRKVQVVGDDLLVTDPERIRLAIEDNLCNALLLKVNQIGTLSESLHAAALAKDAGWNVMVSHRSGETEDPYIADLSVAISCGQIKLGAPCRSDRVSKYNRLLKINSEKKFKYG